jgi:hypothetical protein
MEILIILKITKWEEKVQLNKLMIKQKTIIY